MHDRAFLGTGHLPGIRLNLPVDEPLVQAMHGFNGESRDVIRALSEGHAGTIRGNQFLNDDGHSAPGRVQTQLLSIEQGAVRPQRCPHQSDMTKNRFEPGNVQKRFVQAGIGTLGTILRQAGRPDGDGTVSKGGSKALGQIIGEPKPACLTGKAIADAQRGVPDFLPAHVFKPFPIEFPLDVAGQTGFL